MRMDGLKPEMLFLQVDEEPYSWWEENPHHYETFPYIWIAPGESIGPLDLRFAVGLTVHLTALTVPRMAEAVAALKRAGAKRVISATYDKTLKEVTYLADTETNYVWQAQQIASR